MKIAAVTLIAVVSLLISLTVMCFALQKIADAAPAAIGSMVAQAQVAYQKSHEAAMRDGK